jgi:hypothetical protein
MRLIELPDNNGLEQTAHCLRQHMRHLEHATRLRKRLTRAAAQAACWADMSYGRKRVRRSDSAQS